MQEHDPHKNKILPPGLIKKQKDGTCIPRKSSSSTGRNLKQDRANKSDGEVAADTPETTDAAFKLICSPVCGWSDSLFVCTSRTMSVNLTGRSWLIHLNKPPLPPGLVERTPLPPLTVMEARHAANHVKLSVISTDADYNLIIFLIIYSFKKLSLWIGEISSLAPVLLSTFSVSWINFFFFS